MTFFGGLQTKIGIRSIISKNAFAHHRQFWWCHSSLNRKYYFCFWYCQLLLKTHRCIVRCFVQFYWILNTFLIRVKVKKERPHQSFWWRHHVLIIEQVLFDYLKVNPQIPQSSKLNNLVPSLAHTLFWYLETFFKRVFSYQFCGFDDVTFFLKHN